MLDKIQNAHVDVRHVDEVSRVVAGDIPIAVFSSQSHGAGYRELAETHARAIRRRGYVTGVAYPTPRGAILPEPRRGGAL